MSQISLVPPRSTDIHALMTALRKNETNGSSPEFPTIATASDGQVAESKFATRETGHMTDVETTSQDSFVEVGSQFPGVESKKRTS